MCKEVRHPVWLFGGIPGVDPCLFRWAEIVRLGIGEVSLSLYHTLLHKAWVYTSERLPWARIPTFRLFLSFVLWQTCSGGTSGLFPVDVHLYTLNRHPAPWLSAKIFLFPVAGNWLARWENKGAFVLGHIAFENLAESIQTESGCNAKLCRFGGFFGQVSHE